MSSSAIATARAANPFASFEAERTVVAAISPIILRLARGNDLETKKYEAPPELLALARATARERALRRGSKSMPPAPELEPKASRSGAWWHLKTAVRVAVEWMFALWHNRECG
jgi:hypothetical protein